MKSLFSKKSLIVLLSALFAVCIIFAGVTANKANANTDLEEVTLATTMEQSAQMRLTNPTGMRFIIDVAAEDLEKFDAENVQVVTMITQKNLLDDANIDVADFNKDSNVKMAKVEFNKYNLADAYDVYGSYRLTATILEISDANIAKTYVAKTYITDGEKIGYVEQATEASIYYVATEALNSINPEEEPEAYEVLLGYTKSCTITVEGVPVGIPVAYGSKLSDTIFYGMPECYTIVSIKDGNGAELTKDFAVTEDIELTIELAENHTWVNGECVKNCGTKCAHDWDGADCTICDMTREPSVADTTYAVEYIGIVDGAVTVDLASVNETIVAEEITAVTVNGTAAEWTVDDNGDLVITTATYGENVAVAITVANADEYKTVTFTTIFATHVINDESSFRAYFGKRQANTYAVITNSFNIAETPEIRPESSGAQYGSFTVNGLNNKVEGIYDYSGFFPGYIESGTIKNVTFKVKSYGCALSGEVGNVTLDNVTLNVVVPSSAGKRLLVGTIVENKTFTIKDSAINFLIDSTKLYETYLFAETLNGSINIINSDIYSNGTMVLLGETYNGSAYGNGKITIDAQSTFEDKYDTVTYADEYVVTDGTTFAIDASKINGATVTGVTSAIVGSTTCSASQSGNTISINSSIKGETKLQLVAGNKTYIVGDIIVANFVLSDEATLFAWAKAGHGKAGDRYAVISQDITIVDDGRQIDSTWFGGWTLNGLGHTVKNLYDYSGFMPNGAGNITIKNVTLNIKTCSSILGDDWYGTNNFENVTINASVPGHAGTSRIISDRTRKDTIYNFTNCTINVNVDSALKDKEMVFCGPHNNTSYIGDIGGIKLVNSTIKSTGTIAALNSLVSVDSNSSIIDKNGTK